jgi:hypothetical protein
MEKAMRTYEISSPRAAERYFDDSFVGDVAAFLSALGRRIATRNPERRSARPSDNPPTPKASLLDRLDRWLSRQEQQSREDYLAGSRDVFELERRIDALDRGNASRYY